MPNAIREASRIQVGKEVTAGTLVAATRRLTGLGTVTREQAMAQFEDHMSGTLARVVRAPVVTRNGMTVSYQAPLSYEEILLPLLLGVKGGVTAVGAGADKTWTFLPPPTSAPLEDHYTFEWVEDDLAGNAYEVEAGFGFCESFEITGGVDGVPEMTVNMRMRKPVDSTATPSLAVPAFVSSPSMLFGHYMEDTWAALTTPTNQVLGQIYEFSLTYTTGLTAAHFQDARTGLDFTHVNTRPRSIELTAEVEINPAASGFVRLEQAKKDAGALRFHQLRLTGPTLGAANYSIKVDGAYYHAEDSMTNRGDDRDGVLRTTLHLLSAYDPTGAADVRFIVVNGLAAFP